VIGVTVVGADAVARRLVSAVSNVRKAEEAGVRKASIVTHGELKRAMTGAKGTKTLTYGKQSFSVITGARPPQLGVRTGSTRARLSPGGVVVRSGSTLSSAVGSPDRHVAFHERGGVIRGRPWLYIPMTSFKTGKQRGIARVGMVRVRQVTLPPRGTFAYVKGKVAPLAGQYIEAEVRRAVRVANGGS